MLVVQNKWRGGERTRYFGGTTGQWAGFCSPLDPIDFQDRDWVPNSTWPIELDDLHPFYARANKVLELGPYEYGADYWEKQDPDVRRLPLGENFWPKMGRKRQEQFSEVRA